MKQAFAAFALALASACGPNPYVGTWQVSSGTFTMTCGSQSTTSQENGNVTVTQGASSALEVVGNSCDLQFADSSGTATLSPGQTCATSGTDANGNPFTATETYSSGSISTVDGKIASLALAGSVLVTDQGQSITCTTQTSENLTKVGN